MRVRVYIGHEIKKNYESSCIYGHEIKKNYESSCIYGHEI